MKSYKIPKRIKAAPDPAAKIDWGFKPQDPNPEGPKYVPTNEAERLLIEKVQEWEGLFWLDSEAPWIDEKIETLGREILADARSGVVTDFLKEWAVGMVLDEYS